MEIRKVFLLGAGTMGRGICQASAESGFEVLLADVDPQIVEKAIAAIGAGMQKKVEKGEMKPDERETVLSRIKAAKGIEDAGKADIAIEAVIEDIRKKQEVFSALDASCPPHVILATNTSALSITEIASAVKNPARVVGVHFFNPVPRMKLVEIIRGRETSSATVAAARAFAEKLGKTAVEVNEAPGFIVNRLLIPMINEAIFLVSEGVASKEDIDAAMKLGTGHPMGPFALADLIGLDVCLFILETFEKQFKDGKYRPCPLLRKMVGDGKLGRKTGEGFYKY